MTKPRTRTNAFCCAAASSAMSIGLLGAAVGFAFVPRAGATGVVPPGNPPHNMPPPRVMAASCDLSSDTAASCNSGALQAIDGARSAEGVGPMGIPSNFGDLSSAQQLFVATNLERVDRGLAPVTGMAPTLDAAAQYAAETCCDPKGPPGYSWQSNWATGERTGLAADYDWMYNDGVGSSNMSCPPSCWGHRDNILGPGGLMGAGAFGSSDTELFVQAFPQGPVFSWSEETPYLRPMPASRVYAVDSAPRTANEKGVVVYASGESMALHASLSGSPELSLGASACVARAGHSCTFPIIFRPPVAGLYRSTLTIEGPGGPQAVSIVGASGDGYWQVASDGGVFDFGNGGFRGSLGGIRLDRPIVGVEPTPNRGGYWLVASDGGVFTFGNAGFHGSTGDIRLNQPVVGMGAASDGDGYWLVARDGGIFTFGDAHFYGSTGHIHLNQPIVGMAPTPDGRGYQLVARDGGIFTFGDARFHGSTGNTRLNQPIVAMVSDRVTGGYWLIAADGGVFSFDAPFLGSLGDVHLVRPIVGAGAS